MSLRNPILEAVNQIFAGTDLNQMRMDTLALLRQIAEDAEDDGEITQDIEEVCKSIATVLSAYGKEIDQDGCFQALYTAVMAERSKIAMSRMIRGRRSRRRRRGGI